MHHLNNQKKAKNQWQIYPILFNLFLLTIIFSLNQVAHAATDTVNVTLVNGISGATIVNQRVHAYEILADNTRKWKTAAYTNAQGQTSLVLDGIDSGRSYYLVTKVYNNFLAKTAILTSSNDFTFHVGTSEITLLDGSISPPARLINQLIHFRKIYPDGNVEYFTSATTDAKGLARVDLPKIAQGVSYQISMVSPNNGATIDSDLIQRAGVHTVKMGHLPIKVSVRNGLSKNPIAAIKVHLYERLSNGNNKWRSAQITDANGKISFDISGVDGARQYFMIAKVYANTNTKSAVFTQAGEQVFEIGTTEITVFNAAISPKVPIPNYEVYLIKQDGTGEFVYHTAINTNKNGVIRINLPGLDSGTVYKLKMKSLINDSSVYSKEIIDRPGRHSVSIGSVPLTVTLQNGITGKVIAGSRIKLVEQLSDGTKKWINASTSNAAGKVTFDFDGLDGTRQFYVATKVYNDITTESDLFSLPGELIFNVGSTEIKTFNGTVSPNAPLANTEIVFKEVLADGKHKWYRAVVTDADGIIKINLPGLGKNKTYVIKAKSPITGQYIDVTPALTQTGRQSVVVGNLPLNVKVRNGLSGLAVPALQVYVNKINTDGKLAYFSTVITDRNGNLVLDLPGLGSGSQYVLRSNPYNAGDVYSSVINTSGELLYRLGTVPVRLFDSNKNISLVNKKLRACLIKSDGSVVWYNAAFTNSQGIVHFDLKGLKTGERFVFKVSNPFGANKTYTSRIVAKEGAVDFGITPDNDFKPDLEIPIVSVTSPINKANVNIAGFTLVGSATDNKQVQDITVTVSDPVKGVSAGPANYNASTHVWQYNVPASAISVGADISVSVMATDSSNNKASLTTHFSAIRDQTGPSLIINSHKTRDNVSSTGFTLVGSAVDNVDVTSVLVSVFDSSLGQTVFDQSASRSAGSNQWSFTIFDSNISPGQTAVTVKASDAQGNVTTNSIDLNVTNISSHQLHLANRSTFGVTTALRNEMSSKGAATYLAEQLAPNNIDDSAFEASISGFTPNTAVELKEYMLRHMIYSQRQLREVMTWFWDNHFNTNINETLEVSYELAENKAFRRNALGNFRDLLEISAKSPAMIIFLDNVSNVKAEPNENYARELLELHTMGVDGGYTHADIETLAQIFTGWHLQNGAFFFNATAHNNDSKTFLGQLIPAGGVSQGEQVLDILASHPATATFICTKLGQLFISDTPPTSVVSRCASTFLNSNGNIAQVVDSLLSSSEFISTTDYRAKIKTPLEYFTGIVRSLNAQPDYGQITSALDNMGLNLLENPWPTGWSETGDDWLGSNLFLQRIKFAYRTVGLSDASSQAPVNLKALVQANGMETADAIIGFAYDLLLDRRFSLLEYDIAKNILNQNIEFNLNQADADSKLSRLFGTLLSLPEYQFQ